MINISLYHQIVDKNHDRLETDALFKRQRNAIKSLRKARNCEILSLDLYAQPVLSNSAFKRLFLKTKS